MENLNKKLLAIQKAIKPIEKDSQNPHFKSSYFDINKLLVDVKPILSANNIVVLQPIGVHEGKPVITTILIDAENGDKMETMMLIPDVQDPQKFGAVVSYYRRYALTSFLALSGEDDDAESAKPVATQPTSVQRPTAQGNKPCSQCGKDFTPNPQYPRATTCGWQCANAKKAGTKPELPTIQVEDDRPPFVPPVIDDGNPF